VIFFEKSLTTESGLDLTSAHVEVTGITVRYRDKKTIVDLSVWVNKDARDSGSKFVPDPRMPTKLAFVGESFFDPLSISPGKLIDMIRGRI